MRIPLVGIVSSICTALGLWGLYWYTNLSKEEQAEADKLAADYSMKLYSKGLDQLTAHQMSRVSDLVKGHFAA